METSEILDAAERLNQGLLAKATDGDYLDKDFGNDLRILNTNNRVSRMLPSFLRTSRTTADFRRAMQSKYPKYKERRQYISQELQPIFDYIESVVNVTDSFSNNTDSYELGDVIGNGGFGTVHKYRHKLLDYNFAIKILDPVFVSNEESIEGERRFLREAKFLFQLNHENIIRVFDIGRTNGKLFIRMEFIDGDTLQEFITKNGAVSFLRSKKPIIALLRGLEYAHQAGVIHRDLKPSNLMVTKDSKFKIIDFGISAYIENENHSKLTKTGENVAGGLYTDPMLIENPKLRDVRSDIYSVGAIWYYLLTGRAPAGADSRKILLATNNATELEISIIYKCMANDPNDRYQSCVELLNILLPQNSNAIRSSTDLTNRITEITRETIFDYLLDRYKEEINAYVYFPTVDSREPERVFYYSGRRNVVTFLSRLYDLTIAPSSDSRFITFEDEIFQHTITNDDYEYGWVFRDSRLDLYNGNDEKLLRFLCEMFHPVVRSEKSDWQNVLADINELIKVDGYEIYEFEKISGRSVYSYRLYVMDV